MPAGRTGYNFFFVPAGARQLERGGRVVDGRAEGALPTGDNGVFQGEGSCIIVTTFCHALPA